MSVLFISVLKKKVENVMVYITSALPFHHYSYSFVYFHFSHSPVRLPTFWAWIVCTGVICFWPGLFNRTMKEMLPAAVTVSPCMRNQSIEVSASHKATNEWLSSATEKWSQMPWNDSISRKILPCCSQAHSEEKQDDTATTWLPDSPDLPY